MEYYVNKGKYIIPLDAVDASLMSFDGTIPKKVDDYKPLWSTDVLNLRNENSYYQIDMQEGPNESEARCDDENNELKTYTCFICNVEVPEQYTRAHVDSYKHEMYLSIAKAAIERINKNMNQKCFTTKTKHLMYFCETCDIVVPVANKPVHLQSDLHKKALKRDKRVKKFVNLYVNDDAQLNNEEVILNSKEETEASSNLSKSNLCVDDFRNNWINIFDDKYRTETTITQEAEKKLLNYYGIDDTDTKPAHLVLSIDKNHYLIQIEGERRLKVNFYNYHGIDKLMKQRYQCKLCSETFKRKHKHISSEKHIGRISLVIKDQHCIRELDSTQSHCILCNELFDIDDPHIYSEVHEEQLLKALLNPGGYVRSCEIAEEVLFDGHEKVKDKCDDSTSSSSVLQSDNATGDPFCELCEMFIMEENEIHHVCRRRLEIMPKQLRAEDHTKATEAKLEDIEISKDLVTTEPVAVNQMLEGDFGKKIVQNVCKNIDDVDSYGSENLYVNLISKQTNQVAENVFLIETDLSTKRNEVKNITESVDSEPENVKLCANNLETHNSLLLEGKECMPVAANEAMTQADANTEVKENVNKEEAPPFIEVASQSNKVNGKLTEMKKRHNPVKKHDKFVLHTTSNEKEMFCVICKGIIPNNKRSVKEHLYGAKHTNNVSQLLEDNQIKKTDDMFFCKVCDDHIMPGNQFSHVESKVHKKSLDRISIDRSKNKGNKANGSSVDNDEPSNDLKIKNDQKNVTNSTRRSIIDASSFLPHKDKGDGGKNLDGVTNADDEEEFICYFCHVVLPSDAVTLTAHTKTLKHIQEKSSFLEKHEIFQMGRRFRCLLCAEEIRPNMLFKHVQEQIHLKMLDSWLSFISREDSISDSNLMSKLKLSKRILKKEHLLKTRFGFVAEDWVKNRNVNLSWDQLTDNILNRMKVDVIKSKRNMIKDYKL